MSSKPDSPLRKKRQNPGFYGDFTQGGAEAGRGEDSKGTPPGERLQGNASEGTPERIRGRVREVPQERRRRKEPAGGAFGRRQIPSPRREERRGRRRRAVKEGRSRDSRYIRERREGRAVSGDVACAFREGTRRGEESCERRGGPLFPLGVPRDGEGLHSPLALCASNGVEGRASGCFRRQGWR